MSPMMFGSQSRIGRIGLYAFLGASSLFFLLPLVVMLLTSLKSLPELREGHLLGLPSSWSLEAWRAAWSGACVGLQCDGIRGGFWNSVAILVPSVTLSVLLGALNGYALAFWRMKGAETLLLLLIIAGFVPYQVILFPLVKVLSATSLHGSLPGIVAVHVIFSLPVLVLIFRNYYLGLPAELVKAARIDGASFLLTFRHVVLPLSSGAFAVAGIIQVTGIWNDFLLGLVFAGPDWQPMTVQLNNLVGSTRGEREYNVEMAAALLTALPPLIVYLLSGRWFVRGITAGAIKG